LSYFKQAKGEQGERSSDRAGSEPRLEDRVAVDDSSPENVSTLGRSMVITGNIACNGAIQIFGRVIGDVHAKHLVIGEGAHVDGNLIAKETVIRGNFKGTVHSDSVKIQGIAAVEGEIFNKSLTIEENALFEGMSRRLEKPVVAPSALQENGEKPAWASMAEIVPISGAIGQSMIRSD
jgi:cytoskeletal protein CcmA (bactofilin family)